MILSALLSLAFARPTEFLFSVYGAGAGVECRSLRAGGLGRAFRIELPAGENPEIMGADARRRLVFVRLRAGYQTKAVAAFRYDRVGRLARGAVSPMERAAAAIAFDPTGRFAAVLSERNARTYRVGEDGALKAVDGKVLYGGTGDTVVAKNSGDGRRLFVLNHGGYIDIAWADVRAYAWRPNGTLTPLALNDLPDAQDHYTGIAPDRRGRFVYEFGRNLEGLNVRRLEVGTTARKPPILSRDYDAGAYDDTRKGLYLVKDGRIDWIADLDPTHLRTLGRLATPTTVTTTMRYDARRRELIVNDNDASGSLIGLYEVRANFRLVPQFETNLGLGHGSALWVPN